MYKYLDKLLNNIDYIFNDLHILEEAMTHRSYSYEKKLDYNNERLEYLGDAILEHMISECLFNNCEGFSEGQMTRLRALIVREESLAILATNIGIGDVLRLGRGEDMSGGRKRLSLLSDAFEALIAAVYIDCSKYMNSNNNKFASFSRTKEVFMPMFTELIESAIDGRLIYDYKSALLEKVQENESLDTSEFKEIARSGPDHSPIFTMGIFYRGALIAKASGRSKKEAEQEAAKLAIEKF